MTRTPPQLRIALLLGVASLIATALLFPYVLALQPGALTQASAQLHLPTSAIIALQAVQSGIFCFFLAWIGLKLGAPLGLSAPWLGAALYGRPRPAASAWWQAALLGAAAALLVLGVMAGFGPPLASPHATPPASLDFAFKGLLATPYGAVVEEVGVRVFVMGLAAWLLMRFTPQRAHPGLMYVAIVFAALMFGVGHLPMAAQLEPLSTGIVLRVVLYNALAGCVFGWLYWKRGLEHAMLAHACADLVLHVIAPLASLA